MGPMLDVLARDVSSILRRLKGDRPPSFEVRGRPEAKARANAAATSAPRGITLRRARVVEIVREADDAVSIALVDVAGRPFEHEPGQFLTLQLEVDGRSVRRAYSIAQSSSDRARVAIGVKRVPGGLVSSRLVDGSRVGDELDVLGPSGSFTPPAGTTDALLVAGGSGITPLLRIADALLAATTEGRVVLVFANRSASSVMFAGTLAELAERHPGRFAAVHVHDVLTPGSSALLGPLDGDALEAALDSSPFRLTDDAPAFLCGPEGLMRVARSTLERRGVAPARIFEERFASPEPPRVTEAEAARDAGAKPSPVTFRRKDGSVVVLSPRPGATVLEAGLEANVPLGYSCAMGGCGVCRVKLVAGECSMLEPNCLDDDERAAGHILACVATAMTPVTVEVGA
jgi:ring-1,2-phenylacetyl-CoA epoxidase subunit PaaE